QMAVDQFARNAINLSYAFILHVPVVEHEDKVLDERRRSQEGKMTIRSLVTPAAAGLVGAWLLLMSAPLLAQECDLNGYRLFVDPGHGGSDSGAVGPTGLTEAFVNLEVGLYLRDWLEYFGATVGMSRTTDVFVPLTARAAMANQFGAQRFVSTHENWVD